MLDGCCHQGPDEEVGEAETPSLKPDHIQVPAALADITCPRPGPELPRPR